MSDTSEFAVVLCTIPCTGTTYVEHALSDSLIPSTAVHSSRDVIRKPTRLDWLRQQTDENRRIVCITLTREPLATVISQTFWSFYNHRLSVGQPWLDELEPRDAELEHFHRTFHDVHFSSYMNGIFETYFDTEFREGMGVDVLAGTFPHADGYAIFDRNPAVPGNPLMGACHNLVVLRTDRIDEQLRPALRNANGGRPVPEIRFSMDRIEARMKGASNKNKPYYPRLLQALELTEAQIAAVYDTGYARHFLTDAERRDLIGSWTDRLRKT